MSKTRDPATDQPLPKKSRFPAVHDKVAADVMARQAFGVEKYGQPLQPFNGRDPLRDGYEEVLDLAAYLRQLMDERAVLAKYVTTRWRAMRGASSPPGTGQWRDGYLSALQEIMVEVGIDVPPSAHPLGFFDWRDVDA